MSRPEQYQRLERYRLGHKDRLILGSKSMYTVVSAGKFITCADDKIMTAKSPVIKYKRYWFSTQKQAQNQCDRLTKMCPSRDFEVVEITL